MSKAENTVPGIPVEEMTEEELKSIQQKQAEQKKALIAELNKIAVPVQATFFIEPRPFTIRNIAFWKEMQKKDEMVTEFMDKYLTEQQ